MRFLRGYSLLELLCTLSVASILLSTALPDLADAIKNNRRSALVNEFVSSLQLARNQSIMQNCEVTVCKSSDGRSCGRSGVSWNSGWITFVNADGDDPAMVDTDERLLTIHPAITAPLHVTANREYFSFRPLPYRSVNGTIRFCDDRGAPHAAVVIINVMGRPRLSHAEADGSPVNCSE